MRIRHLLPLAAVPIAVVLLSACSDKLESGIVIVEDVPGLLARAAVSPDSAIAIALNRVQGKIEKAEIEEEDGELIYSFDIGVGGEDGITEVHVDAMMGTVLSIEHEAEGEGGDEM